MKKYIFYFITISAAIFLFSLNTFAKSKSAKTHSPATLSILGKYSSATALQFSIEKTDEKKALGTKSSQLGQLIYSSGKINLVLNGDKKTEVIFNGKSLWLIEYPDVDFDPKGKRKITLLAEQQPVIAKQLVSVFSSPTVFAKSFSVVSEKIEGATLTAEYKSANTEIKNFKIDFNTKTKLIEKISFVDDVQTQTSIVFQKTQFLTSAPKGVFQFIRKKNDEVM